MTFQLVIGSGWNWSKSETGCPSLVKLTNGTVTRGQMFREEEEPDYCFLGELCFDGPIWE